MANSPATLDRVFHALSDPTRRAIVLRLSAEPAIVGELFDPMPMALPTLLKHIHVLEDCGLVTTRKEGRTRICEIHPEALQATDTFLAQQRAIWNARLDRMEAHILKLQHPEKKNVRTKKHK